LKDKTILGEGQHSRIIEKKYYPFLQIYKAWYSIDTFTCERDYTKFKKHIGYFWWIYIAVVSIAHCST
jgi:hypothetical protein